MRGVEPAGFIIALMRRTCPSVLTFILLALPVCAAQQAAGSAGFAARAWRTLPVEEPYAFVKALSEGPEPLRRDPATRPSAAEVALPAQGWTLVILKNAGMVLRQAAGNFRAYLDSAMQTKLELRTVDSLDNWTSLQRTVVAGVRSQMPGCGAALKNPKDYQIVVAGDRVAVCGFDERGAMYGLYNLEARMNLREAPILPRNLNAVRHSLFRARMTLSGLGWMEWPDKYLATIARYGFDSIFCSVYRNPNNAPGVPPYWDKMRSHPPGKMKDLIRRAARQGLDVYTPIIYRFDGTPENQEGLRKLVRNIVRAFPDIRGYVLLTEGFFYDNWFGAGGHGKQDLHDWARQWARGVEIVVDECRKLNPAIEVLPWEYNIDFRPEQVELKRYFVNQLPRDAIPLLTFENGKGFELDGERGWLKDYAINQAGPAEVTAAQIAAARERGMRAVYSKADTFASWQFGTMPYLPFPYQWYARYQALREYGVDGTMESWSYGFKPNFVAEIRAWDSWSEAPPIDELLRSVARRDFGPGSEAKVLAAWKSFSEASRLVPDTGPNWGTCNAVAAPFFFQKPKPRAMTLEHSWNDQRLWSRESQLNAYWPYVPARLFLWPDFSNRINVAERYVKPFSLPVFQKYLLLAADKMEEGLKSYREAALRAPSRKQAGAFREVLLAEQLQRMMRSEHALLEFEDLRYRLGNSRDSAGALDLLDRMEAILKAELIRTGASWETARRDSRLGYEWEQDYIYTPETINEKRKLLRLVLNEQFPARRWELRQKNPSRSDQSF